MTGDEANEVFAIIRRVGPVVMSSAMTQPFSAGAALRRAVGMMIADKSMTDLSVFCFAFKVCTDLARHCGATLVTMDRVRKAALKEKPQSLPATLVVMAIVRLTLATEARILAYMTFRSRDEVEDIAVQMHAAFSETTEIAADDLDAGTFAALVALHGAVTVHLADNGRRLPRVIAYKNQTVLPALRMAQRTYADPVRYVELIDENEVVHPAFMPLEGKMLAV